MYITTLQYVLTKRRFRKLLGLLVLISLILTLLLLPAERSSGSQIKQPFDALWFAVTTMTGVGYGDYVPLTVVGKTIGMTLQFLGVMMFGVLIALLSISLNRAQDEFILKRMRERFEDVDRSLDRIEKMLTFIMKSQVDEMSKPIKKKQD